MIYGLAAAFFSILLFLWSVGCFALGKITADKTNLEQTRMIRDIIGNYEGGSIPARFLLAIIPPYKKEGDE